MSIHDIRKKAEELAQRKLVDSINPGDVGGLIAELAEEVQDTTEKGSNLGIRKTYKSIAEMESDKNPVDEKGVPLMRGMLVNIFNQDNTSSTDNGKIFSFEKPGWVFRTRIDAHYATKEELNRLDDDITKLENRTKKSWNTAKFGGVLEGSVTVIQQSINKVVSPENVLFYNSRFVFRKEGLKSEYFENALNGNEYNETTGRTALKNVYFIHETKQYYFDGNDLKCLSTNIDAPDFSGPLLSEMTGDEILFLTKNGVNHTIIGETIKEYCIKELENKVFPVVLIVYGGGLYEKGTSTNILIQWNTTREGKQITPELSKINGEVVSGSSKQYYGVTTDTTYNVEVTYKGNKVTESKKATFVAPMFFGFDASENTSTLNIKSLVKQQIKSSPNGYYSLTNDMSCKYLWLCVPKGMKINSVKSSGFDVPMETQTIGTTDISEYLCYRSSSKINAGFMDINIS